MVQWHTSLVALQHVGSFQTRDWTPVSCIGRQIPHHRDLREAPKAPFFNQCCWWQGSYSPWYGDMTWPCQVNPCQHSSSGSDHVFSSLASAHLALSFLHLEAPTSPCWSPAYPTDGGHGLHIQQLTGTHPVTIARWVSLFFFDNKACAYCGPRAKQWIQTQTSLSSGQTRGIPLRNEAVRSDYKIPPVNLSLFPTNEDTLKGIWQVILYEDVVLYIFIYLVFVPTTWHRALKTLKLFWKRFFLNS